VCKAFKETLGNKNFDENHLVEEKNFVWKIISKNKECEQGKCQCSPIKLEEGSSKVLNQPLFKREHWPEMSSTMQDLYGAKKPHKDVKKLYKDVMTRVETERLINVVGELGIGKKTVVRKVAELMYERDVFEDGIVIIENKDDHTSDDIV